MEDKTTWDFNAPQYFDFNSPIVNDASGGDYFITNQENVDPISSPLTTSEATKSEISVERVGVLEDSVIYSPSVKNAQSKLTAENLPLELQLTVPVTPNVLKRKPREKKQKEEVDLKSVKKNYAEKRVQVAKKRIINNQRSKELKEGEFANTLRGADKNLSDYHPFRTIPQPFTFRGKSNREVNKVRVETMAEQCIKFSSKTPQRFRRKAQPEHDVAVKQKLTMPRTPNLLTKMRMRSVQVLSQIEKEEMEAEEVHLMQFKAIELNRKILHHPSLPIKVPAKPTTIIKEFALSEGTQKVDQSLTEGTSCHFIAHPMPTHIFKGPVGVGPRNVLPLTIPMSPAFSKLHATKKGVMTEETINSCDSKKKSPGKEGPLRTTKPVPFSFSGKAQDRKQKLLEEELLKERKARKFIANLLPDMSASPTLPCKRSRPSTLVEPFELAGGQRFQESHQRWMEKVEVMEEQEREMKEFRARPATVLNKPPFLPEFVSNQSLLSVMCDSRNVPSNTEKRAMERKEWQEWLTHKEHNVEEMKKKIDDEENRKEESEIRKIRAGMIQHALPIRHYNGVVVQPSAQLLTIPESPEFSDRISNKYLDKSLRADLP